MKAESTYSTQLILYINITPPLGCLHQYHFTIPLSSSTNIHLLFQETLDQEDKLKATLLFI